VTTTVVVGAAQWRLAAAASPPAPYFSCPATATLCVESLQFQSTESDIDDNDQADTRTADVHNNTAGPVTITGYKFLGDTTPPTFQVYPTQSCIGRTLQPGEECGFDVTVMLAGRSRAPEDATLEVDGTAGSGSGATAISGTGDLEVYQNIRPDNDLYVDQPWLQFGADFVGGNSSPQTVTLTGYGAIPEPPIHAPVVKASGTGGGSPAGIPGFYSVWYRVTGASVISDVPAGFPTEYLVDTSGCNGKSLNVQASATGGAASCGISVTAVPQSDGDRTAILDITYCSVEVSITAACTNAAPRHVLVKLETLVPWNPGECDTLCVEPLTFLPIGDSTQTTVDPTLIRTSTVYNGTGEPVTITDTVLQHDDGVFDVYPLNTCLGATIAAGGECGVSVRLHDDGKQHLQTALRVDGTETCIDAGINLASPPPAASVPTCTVTGIGSVTARSTSTRPDNDLYAVPAALNVGSATVGTTTPAQNVTLTGWADLTEVEFPHPQWNRVIGVQVIGPQAGDFRADAGDCAKKDVNINAGAGTPPLAGVPSCRISIAATPSATGMRQAYLDVTYCTIDDNPDLTPQAACFDTATPRHVLVGLTALGVAPPPGCHALCVQPLDFLPPPAGTDPTTVRTSAVFNGTGAPVTVTAESFVNGANRFDVFPTETCIGHTLAPGGECAVSVRYTDDGAAHPTAALKVDGVDPATGGAVSGQGGITVRTAARPDNDLYAVPSVLDFGDQAVGKRSGPLSVTLTGWGATAAGPLWYRVVGVTVLGDAGDSQPGDYQADGSNCAGKALNLKADPATGFIGSRSCAISVTDLPPAPGVRPAGLDVTYCTITAPSAPCDGTTIPGHVLVGLTANGTRPTFHAQLTASPAVSPAGRVVHITGTGFPVDAAVVLALTRPGTPPATAPAALSSQLMKAAGRTDADGALSLDLLIMPETTVGTYPLQAIAVDIFGNQGAAQLGYLIVPGTQQVLPGTPPRVLPWH
jgi:hypothetical protein